MAFRGERKSSHGVRRTYPHYVGTDAPTKPEAGFAAGYGARTICLHSDGKPASVSGGFGLRGGGCNVDSLNQKSSARPQPSLGSGEAAA
jgi:hypothetical protein